MVSTKQKRAEYSVLPWAIDYTVNVMIFRCAAELSVFIDINILFVTLLADASISS